jgi:4-amino-4-deoxy-L-arabinose transferase-like glycosyltransferase
MKAASETSIQAVANEESTAIAGEPWKYLGWIFVMALAIRLMASFLLVASYAERWAHDGEDHWTFAYETGRVARSIATGHGFSDPLKVPSGPTAWLAPVYPLVLAAVFKVFGIYSLTSTVAIRVFNSFVSALICVPVFFITRKDFGERTGIWAACAWALFPHGVWAASAIVWDSSLTALILACLVWSTMELQEVRPIAAWGGYGVMWGVGALTNPTILAALPFLLAWLWFRRGAHREQWILEAGVTAVVCLAVMSPWLMRNYRVFHQPFLIKSNLWLEFVVGNSVHQTSFWNADAHPDDSPSELREFVERGEAGYMAEKKKEAIDFIGGHLSLYFWLCVRRFVYTWTGFWSLSREFLASKADGGLRHIALITAYTVPTAMGLRRTFRLGKNAFVPLASILVCVPLVTYLTHPWAYYRFIIDPEIVILATIGILPGVSFLCAKLGIPIGV